MQLQRLGRLAGLIVYGSPYLWQSLQAVLEPQIPAAYSPGQMPQAQTLALQSLGLGPGFGDTEAGSDARSDFTD
jgi:beta-glucosidase